MYEIAQYLDNLGKFSRVKATVLLYGDVLVNVPGLKRFDNWWQGWRTCHETTCTTYTHTHTHIHTYTHT